MSSWYLSGEGATRIFHVSDSHSIFSNRNSSPIHSMTCSHPWCFFCFTYFVILRIYYGSTFLLKYQFNNKKHPVNLNEHTFFLDSNSNMPFFQLLYMTSLDFWTRPSGKAQTRPWQSRRSVESQGLTTSVFVLRLQGSNPWEDHPKIFTPSEIRKII